MPGIATERQSQINVGDIRPAPLTPAVANLMDSFREGFITADDIFKRTAGNFVAGQEIADQTRQRGLNRELEPLVQDLKKKELGLRSTQLDAAAKVAPIADEATLLQLEDQVKNIKSGGDLGAFRDTYRQLLPGKPLPRNAAGEIDINAGQEDIEIEIKRIRQLQEAKLGAANIKEVKSSRFNPKTGEEEEIIVRLNALTGEKLGEPIVVGSKARNMTEAQGNALQYATRLSANNQILENLEKSGFDAAALGTTVQKFVPNRFKSEDVQSYNAAKNNWISAVLRKESGAAISKSEYENANREYFPQDGDSKSVVKQKQALRELAEENMKRVVGPEGASINPAPLTTPAAAPAEPPGSSRNPFPVSSPAEAPETVQFISDIKTGRVFRNPRYRAAPTVAATP